MNNGIIREQLRDGKRRMEFKMFKTSSRVEFD